MCVWLFLLLFQIDLVHWWHFVTRLPQKIFICKPWDSFLDWWLVFRIRKIVKIAKKKAYTFQELWRLYFCMVTASTFRDHFQDLEEVIFCLNSLHMVFAYLLFLYSWIRHLRKKERNKMKILLFSSIFLSRKEILHYTRAITHINPALLEFRTLKNFKMGCFGLNF